MASAGLQGLIPTTRDGVRSSGSSGRHPIGEQPQTRIDRLVVPRPARDGFFGEHHRLVSPALVFERGTERQVGGRAVRCRLNTGAQNAPILTMTFPPPTRFPLTPDGTPPYKLVNDTQFQNLKGHIMYLQRASLLKRNMGFLEPTDLQGDGTAESSGTGNSVMISITVTEAFPLAWDAVGYTYSFIGYEVDRSGISTRHVHPRLFFLDDENGAEFRRVRLTAVDNS